MPKLLAVVDVDDRSLLPIARQHHILTGYRTPRDSLDCLKTALPLKPAQFHNEFCNIYSHLIPGLLNMFSPLKQ